MGEFLILFLKKMTGIWNASLWKQTGKIAAGTVLSCLSGWLAYQQISLRMGKEGIPMQFLLVFLPIGVTVLFYWFFCSRMGVNEVTVLREWMKKKISRTA